jgi:hypothetical protein
MAPNPGVMPAGGRGQSNGPQSHRKFAPLPTPRGRKSWTGRLFRLRLLVKRPAASISSRPLRSRGGIRIPLVGSQRDPIGNARVISGSHPLQESGHP